MAGKQPQPDDANVSPTDPLPGNSGEKGTSPDATGSQAGLSPTLLPLITL